MESLLQVVPLAGLIQVARFLLPKSARATDRFALICTLASAALVLFLWLLMGFVPVFQADSVRT